MIIQKLIFEKERDMKYKIYYMTKQRRKCDKRINLMNEIIRSSQNLIYHNKIPPIKDSEEIAKLIWIKNTRWRKMIRQRPGEKILDFIAGKYKYKIDPNDQRLIGWKDKIRWLSMKRTRNKITTYILKRMQDDSNEDLVSFLIFKNSKFENK
jgi:hypothetical protein